MQIVVSQCCDMTDGKDMSSLRHWTMVHPPCTRCFATCAKFRSMNCESIWNMAGTLSVQGKFETMMDNVCGMNAALYVHVRQEDIL